MRRLSWAYAGILGLSCTGGPQTDTGDETDSSDAGDATDSDTGMPPDPCRAHDDAQAQCEEAGCQWFAGEEYAENEACSKPQKNYCFSKSELTFDKDTSIVGWDDDLGQLVVLPVGGCTPLDSIPPGFHECGTGDSEPEGCQCYCSADTCVPGPDDDSCNLPMVCDNFSSFWGGHSQCIMQAIVDQVPAYHHAAQEGDNYTYTGIYMNESGTLFVHSRSGNVWDPSCTPPSPPWLDRCEITYMQYFVDCASDDPVGNCTMDTRMWPMDCTRQGYTCTE